MTNAHLKYNSFTEVLVKKFGSKVHRFTLQANLTCPNRDGTISTNGCVYCNDDALLGKSWHKQQNINDQIAYGIKYIQERHNARKYLAHFQNGTNTNAPTELLRKLFFEPLKYDNVVGLIISTRPDCLSNDVIDLLSELNDKTYLWVELGLQSPYDETLHSINRGHDFACFENAINRLNQKNIQVCAHVILGLPGEDREKILEGTKIINALPLNGIKIHNLFVIKDTPLAEDYAQGRFTVMSLEEYAALCVDYLERLRPDIIIHRLNAHAPARLTVAPLWSVNKLATLNAIHAEMAQRKSWQGHLC